MKHATAFVILLSAICSFGVTIPLASPRQIAVSPLERGEAALIEHDGSYAELYVGGQNKMPLRVIDGSSLRGYRVRILEPSEYSVSADSGWTHNVENGTYTMTQEGPTNVIIVMTKGGVAVENVSIETEFQGEGLMPGNFVRNHIEYDENVCRWEAAFDGATALIVNKITVKVRDIGEIDWLNDTEDVTFRIKDKLGQYSLYDLRYYLLHYYDRNRGEDWSAYKARKPIRLDGNSILFTDNNRFTMSVSSASNLVLQSEFHDTIEVNIRTNAPIDYTTFSITDIDVGSANQGEPITVDFTTDISGFNADNLGVKVCSDLGDKLWIGLPKSEYTVSNVSTSGVFSTGTVTITHGISGNIRFVRLLYGAATSDVVDLVLHGRVIVKDLLIIKGTDSKFYRIDVNGGTITATEVSL